MTSGADEGGGEHERRNAIDHRAGESHGELAKAVIRRFLAFRVGVGEEASDGKQKHGAQAELEIGGNHKSRNLAYYDGGNAE